MLLRIARVRPLAGRSVSLTLTDGTVIERDLQDVLRLGGVLAPIEASDAPSVSASTEKRPSGDPAIQPRPPDRP